jgi:ubiquinone/menaquinone biosynthesis C-methylase UbiE
MHTGGTQKALDEAFRVLVPGGEAIVMLYHKNSLQYRFYVQILGRKFDDGAPIASFIRGLKWISSAGCSSLPNGRLTIFFGRMYPAWERSCRRNSRSY